MRHALRRLREELKALQETRSLLDGDPSGVAGSLGQANLMVGELQLEIFEVQAAIDLLEQAERARPQPAPQTASVRTARGRRLACADQAVAA